LIDALASAESDFEDASGVFSRVSFQTDNTPFGEVDDEPNQLRLLRRDQETLRSSHKELQEEYMRLSARFTLLDGLYTAADPQKALAAAMDGLGDLVGVESCAIFILAPDNQRLLLAASRALPVSVPTSLPPTGPLARALSEKVLQVPSQPWAAEGSGWSVMAAIPLLFDGDPRGVITIHGLYRQKAALTTYDHRMLELLGQSLGPALFHASLMKKRLAAVGRGQDTTSDRVETSSSVTALGLVLPELLDDGPDRGNLLSPRAGLDEFFVVL